MLSVTGLMESDEIYRKGLRKEFATITAINFKQIKGTNKNNPHDINGWGLFIDLLLDDEITKLTCVWKIRTGSPQASFIAPAFTELPTIHNVYGRTIGTILTALGIKETKDLVGLEVKIKRTSTSIRIAPVAKYPKSKNPQKILRNGGWIFADLFEFADIESLIVLERTNDLKCLFREKKDEILNLSNDLWAIANTRMLDKIPGDHDGDSIEKMNISDDPDADKENHEKKHTLVDFLEETEIIEERMLAMLERTAEQYPEAKSELSNIKDKIDKAFLNIDVDKVDLE